MKQADPHGDPPDDPPPQHFGTADLRRLGFHLRARRETAGLSLRQLSACCGVSVASISALERARSSPGLGIVVSVAQALGLSIDAAVEEACRLPRRVNVTRAPLTRGKGAYRLSCSLEDAALNAAIITLAPGAIGPLPGDLAAAPTLCLVLEGEIIASQGNARRVRLAAGDAYHARAGEVSSWANGGGVPGRLLCVAQRGGFA